MEEIVVYVHGKGGSAQEAEHYKALFPDCEVIGFDYHAQSPWEATEEFFGFFTAVRKRCGKLTLVANSIQQFYLPKLPPSCGVCTLLNNPRY